MNIAGLQAFMAIVQTTNLTKAAELLHLTPSTISYRLKTLEQQLGVLLVERGKGTAQIRLTPSGENFVTIAERWSLLLQETTMFRNAGAQISINISAPNSLSTSTLVPLYQSLFQHEPRVRFRVRTQHTEEAIESVARRDMDIAFVTRELPLPATLILTPFIEEEMVLLRLVDPERTGTSPVDAETLDPEYEVYWNWGLAYQRWHDQHWDPGYPRRIQVDIAHLIPALIVDPRQWAIVVSSLAEVFVRTGRFTIARLADPPANRTCFKIKHKYPSVNSSRGLSIIENYLEKY